MANRRGWDRLDAVAAGFFVICAFAVAACKLTALSWDGSWYLFRTLQEQSPFTPHGRYGTYPILLLVVRLAKLNDDPRFLGVCYGLLLALIPIGSLALSWFFLRRDEHAPLRVWPALGILLTSLPGQLCLMSEATLVAQLLWPILAIMALGPPGIGSGTCLLTLSVAIGFLHPTSSLVFALVAFLFGWKAWTVEETRRVNVIWMLVFGAFTLGKLWLTFLYATDYERGQLASGKVWEQFESSILGYPLLLLMLTYLFGFGMLAPRKATGRWYSRLPGQALCISIGAMMLVGGLYWADDPAHWRGLLDYRRFVLPAACPLVAMAIWHFCETTRAPLARRPSPRFLLSGIAAVFGIILTSQSLVWGSLVERFSRELSGRAAHERFVTADELSFIHTTALDHWTICPLSILLQGRRPRTLFIRRLTDLRPGRVQVNAWEEVPLVDGWFTLAPLGTPDSDK